MPTIYENIPLPTREKKSFSQEDYYAFYVKEKEINRDLEQELAFHRIEIEKFKHEAAKAYMLSKSRHRDNAMMTAQADKILKDLHAVNKNLRLKVQELDKANKDIQEAYKDTINRLVIASEYKDNETGDHIKRMTRYSVFLAKLYGLEQELLDQMEYAAPMHDIGKIGIKDSILLKNGKLDKDEFDEMKKHTTIGATILHNPKAPILECARQIALCHHEKWNGSGYPNGVKGDEIPIYARIVSVCDTFDALTSKRPYKAPYPIDVSCDIITKGKGIDFDPELVDLFIKNIDGFVSIKNEISGDNTVDEEDIKAKFTWSERDRSGSNLRASLKTL